MDAKKVLRERFDDIFLVFTFGGLKEQLGTQVMDALRSLSDEEQEWFLGLLKEKLKNKTEKQIEQIKKKFKNWLKKEGELPKILGESFSYNSLIIPYSLFSRFVLTKVLEKDKRLDKLEPIFLFKEDIEVGDKNLTRWLRRDTTLAQRTFAKPSLFLKSRTNTKLLFALFTYYLLQSEFTRGKTKELVSYLGNLLKNSLAFEEDRKVIEELFNEWKEWLLKHVPIRKNSLGEYVVLQKPRTMLAARILAARWITKTLSRYLKLIEGQSDQDFFPELHKVVIEKVPNIEEETAKILLNRKKIPPEALKELKKV